MRRRGCPDADPVDLLCNRGRFGIRPAEPVCDACWRIATDPGQTDEEILDDIKSGRGLRPLNRAERRRADRERDRGAARYVVSRDQIAEAARQQYHEDVRREREAARVDAAGDAMVLMLAIPCAVLCRDYGWPPEMMRKFVDRALDLYGGWERGEVSMEELERVLWERGGVRFERGRASEDSSDA